jgi:hypothetical protein
MAIEFLNAGFGNSLQYGFLTASRGSWNTTAPNNFRGFKVIYGHLSSAQDTTVDYVADFCAGFLTDTVNRVFWGRPVGIVTDKDGRVYISSDEGNKFILVLSPNKPTGMTNPANGVGYAGTVYPNPGKNMFTLPPTLPQSTRVRVTLDDIAGKEVRVLLDETLPAGKHQEKLVGTGLIPGNYLLKVAAGTQVTTQKLVVVV